MVQKEVAMRISKEEKESILSLSVKAYGNPKYVHTVSRNLFRPVPNVDSAILAVYDISKNFFDGFTELQFFQVVKASFAHKRKKMASNLTEILPKEKIQQSFADVGLSLDSRAEDLCLTDWKKLISSLFSTK
jgi:16S rRNA (adenine1518-N6/adenine1519-N6)-dimethyltransferase